MSSARRTYSWHQGQMSHAGAVVTADRPGLGCALAHGNSGAHRLTAYVAFPLEATGGPLWVSLAGPGPVVPRTTKAGVEEDVARWHPGLACRRPDDRLDGKPGYRCRVLGDGSEVDVG